MTPADRAALEIGRLFMRAHAAEALAEQLAADREQAKAELEALKAEHETKEGVSTWQPA